MKRRNYRRLVQIVTLFAIVGAQACSERFLDVKPSSTLVIPKTLEECRMLLDNEEVSSLYMPTMGMLASDEYYVGEETWQASPWPIARTCYNWNDDVYEGQQHVDDWNSSFRAIFICNAVLNILETIPVEESNRLEWESVKAAALFYRAYRYFALTEVFTLPFSPEAADRLPGLPLRISAGVDITVPRSSLRETFNFIYADLNEAKSLVSSVSADVLNRPSLAAICGALARVSLVAHDVEGALLNAEASLDVYDRLMDFNTLATDTDYPFETNPEIIYEALMRNYDLINPYPWMAASYIDTTLIDSYDDTDLRKRVFFHLLDDGAHRKFLYGYNGGAAQPFAGLSTNEMYLIKAECLARLGNVEAARTTMARLLVNRYEAGTFDGWESRTPEVILQDILEERRKELVFRGARWSDVRRLNTEGAQITMERNLNGKIYTLPYDSPKFAFPIPDTEIKLAGLTQNKQ